MSYSLLVLNGSNPGNTLHLDSQHPVVSIGRHRSRELTLDDDRASRLHARVLLRGDRWHLEDCGSLNGTTVNSQPIKQVLLEPGDLIRIGERLILFVQNRGEGEGSSPATDLLRSDTLVGRVPEADHREALVEEGLGSSMSRVVRDSTVLCRLANELYRHKDTASLIRVAIEALVDGISAERVSVWLVGADGRLRRAACRGEISDGDGDHVLASLAVEKREPIFDGAALTDFGGRRIDDTVRKIPRQIGTALSVPIPGQTGCHGAIECRRAVGTGNFAPADLDFSVVVAHQTGLALENLEHRERLEQANQELRQRLTSHTRLAGSSQVIQDVHDQISRVGPTASTVLVLGESGTGKELVAHLIHQMSPRKDGPYVAVNCAAFSESLLESELFGHEAGAFTGADQRRIGQFERAHRGTIFLDEVGEMSPAVQAKLLRLLEGHPFERVGGHESMHVDVRMIAATHRDLEALVRREKFREDLFYRLRVIDIRIPPLRERGDDAVELASLFLEHYRRQIGRGPRCLSAAAIDAIGAHPWPGNVRELKNAVERAVVLGRSDELLPADLGLAAVEPRGSLAPTLTSLHEAEARHIRYVLKQVDGNKTEACRILEIGRGTLYNKLADLGEHPDPAPIGK